MIKIKVCGNNNPEVLEALCALPIDYLGFIYYDKSPRFINRPTIDAIKIIDPDVRRIGVFVSAMEQKVIDTTIHHQLDWVQLHGNESANYCKRLKSFGLRIIKAFSVDKDFDFSVTKSYESSVDYFLFDTKGKQHGGNGEPFDWTLLQQYQGKIPFFLAGGIGPSSVTALAQFSHPQWWGIDVNSQFELEPGKKDVGLLAKFMADLKEIKNEVV